MCLSAHTRQTYAPSSGVVQGRNSNDGTMTENQTPGELHELDNSDAVQVPKVKDCSELK